MVVGGSTWEWDPGRSSPRCNPSQTAGGGHRDSRGHLQSHWLVDNGGEFVCPPYLHAQDGKDVDDDEEDEGEVSQGAQGGDDDTQQDL